MGRRGGAPPERGTLEVIDEWVDASADREASRSGGGARVLVALALVVGVTLSFLSSATPEGSESTPDERSAGVGDATVAPPTVRQPVGAPLVVLSMSGVAVLDLDEGTFDELDLGSVRSFGSVPALVALGPRRVAVLFSDRSVGFVDLDERSITRVAEAVQAIFPTARPGGVWIRRLRADGAWELTQLGADGAARSVPMEFRSPVPPRMHAGRPIDASGPVTFELGSPDGPFLVEVHERQGTLQSFDVRIEDRATGEERWLEALPYRPVLSPDGRRLLVGSTTGNRLTSYDVATLAAETVDVPRSGAVGLDWGNVVVLPTQG